MSGRFWENWKYDPQRPRIADLCCGAGGAAKGIYDSLTARGLRPRIVGFDIRNQAHYPYSFVRMDALDVDLGAVGDRFDFIWASPPCQKWSVATTRTRYVTHSVEYPDALTPLRPQLIEWGGPYIIENVMPAPLINPVMLCGQMLGLKLLRHRGFESNLTLTVPEHRSHAGLVRGPERDFVVVVSMAADRDIWQDGGVGLWRRVMHMPWARSEKELAEAVHPKYAQYLVDQWKWPCSS